MNTDKRSKYTVVLTVYLDPIQREECLTYARVLFGPQTDPRAGNTIEHLLQQRGRLAIVEAHQYAQDLAKAQADLKAVATAKEQGGDLDDQS